MVRWLSNTTDTDNIQQPCYWWVDWLQRLSTRAP